MHRQIGMCRTGALGICVHSMRSHKMAIVLTFKMCGLVWLKTRKELKLEAELARAAEQCRSLVEELDNSGDLEVKS